MTAMKIAFGMIRATVRNRVDNQLFRTQMANRRRRRVDRLGPDLVSRIALLTGRSRPGSPVDPTRTQPQRRHAGASDCERRDQATGSKTASQANRLRRHRFATGARISSLSSRLFTSVRIAPAAAANASSTPERLFFHGANRSEAPAVLSLRCRYRRISGQLRARGTRYSFARHPDRYG
jgi:hypothetical protein